MLACSAARRALWALACIAASGLAVWAVERPRPAPPAAVRAARAAGAAVWPLAVESSFPVHAWRISVDGAPLAAEHADAWRWQGMVRGAPGAWLTIIAEAAEGDPAPHHALRVVLAGQPERLLWGAGAVAAVLPLP